jgi:hypothetical protein
MTLIQVLHECWKHDNFTILVASGSPKANRPPAIRIHKFIF